MIAPAAAPPAMWSRWWVLMWIVLAAVLIPLAFVLTLQWWAVAAAIGFGVPELIGIRKKDDRYPPLTHVISRYTKRWYAIPLMGGLIAAATVAWFGGPWPWVVGIFAAVTLHDWAEDHFDVEFDNRKKDWPMLDKLPRIAKAIAGAVIATVAAIGTGLADGEGLSSGEIWTAVGAFVVGLGGVWAVPNKPEAGA